MEALGGSGSFNGTLKDVAEDVTEVKIYQDSNTYFPVKIILTS